MSTEDSLVSAGTASTTEEEYLQPTEEHPIKCSVHMEAKCRDACARNFTNNGPLTIPEDVRCCSGCDADRGEWADICRDDECRLNDGEYVLERNRFYVCKIQHLFVVDARTGAANSANAMDT